MLLARFEGNNALARPNWFMSVSREAKIIKIGTKFPVENYFFNKVGLSVFLLK